MTRPSLTITAEDPATPDIMALLELHLAEAYETTPAESVHALDVAELQHPSITFLAVRDADGALMGMGAVKQHDASLAEIKSMRTLAEFRGRGVARALLVALVDAARANGAEQVALETGIEDFFIAARGLYESMGFEVCEPFADYRPDPLSVFYALDLS